MTAATLPLAGTRVLDLTRVLAGPLATMILGDLGADVVKVERPGAGDETRAWGPPFDSRGESAYYLCCNRNKLGVAADLNVPADQAFVRGLAVAADVVVDNFLPGMLEKRGLDPVAVLAENQRGVWCTISGFGPGNPRPGYDFVVQAEAGWMSITGEPGGAPMKSGVALADIGAGKDVAVAILAALLGVRAGRASERRLTVSLQWSATASLINVAQNALVSGADPGRWGNAHANVVPYQLFAASDRGIVIAAANDAQFAALVGVLGVERLRAQRFVTNAGRLEHRADVIGAIAERVAERLAGEWIPALERAGVPCGLVRTVKEALADVEASPLSGVAPQPPGTVRRPPPRLDEHGALVRAHGWGAFAQA